MIIHASDMNEGVKRAVEILRNGGLVIYPTDTLYGLGASALDEPAIKSVFAAKKRPASNPLPIAVSSIKMIKAYAEFPSSAEKLAGEFLPGALTMVLKKKNLPDTLTAGLPNVGIRIPDSDIILKMIEFLGSPITATSANISGNAPPTRAEDALSQIPEADIVLDGGELDAGLPSTIIDLTGKPRILREGVIKRVELEHVIGEIE